jgi:hypothetical protein
MHHKSNKHFKLILITRISNWPKHYIRYYSNIKIKNVYEICKILCKRILIKTKISNYVCMSETRYWNNLLTSSILKVKRLEIQMIQKPLGARKAMGLKRISIHSSKRHPLAWLSQITVRFKGILKSATFPNSQIYGRFIG